ncbi:MAG: acylphosphatase [Acidobacteriota bacterium]|nr:acylphosphatase [Acidobacteriota bacterium]
MSSESGNHQTGSHELGSHETATCLVVEGRVQGVGFRYFTAQTARELGLRGTVRNTSVGTVEIQVVGEPGLVEQLRQRVSHGPPASHVQRVVVLPLDKPPATRSFDIIR